VRRRAFLAAAACLATGAFSQEKVIRIEARKFEFVPDTVTLQVGVPVVFELYAPETHMGFAVDALGLNLDLPAGKPVRLPFTPAKTGEFEFACDVFCGSGHEEMSGTLKVVA
jgi:cytochrome c oxidase subunit 2